MMKSPVVLRCCGWLRTAVAADPLTWLVEDSCGHYRTIPGLFLHSPVDNTQRRPAAHGACKASTTSDAYDLVMVLTLHPDGYVFDASGVEKLFEPACVATGSVDLARRSLKQRMPLEPRRVTVL